MYRRGIIAAVVCSLTPACGDATCTLPVCGDGIVSFGEACDDGNAKNNDTCTNACDLPVCGDAITGPGEQCDDGNDVDESAACNANCTAAACGDGLVNPTAGEPKQLAAHLGRFTCALLTNNTLRCWGDNLSGQLGVGNFQDQLIPQPNNPVPF